MHPHPTLVFDLDGTLVDTAPDLIASLNAVMDHLGLARVPAADAQGLIGGGARMLILKGLELNDRPVADVNLPALTQLFIEDYKTHIATNSVPYEGCIATLEHYKTRGVPLAVCTNKHESLARQLLDTLKLSHYFDTIIGGNTLQTPDGGNISKPDPRPLFAAMTPAHADARNAILIGDSITDLSTAKNAVIPFIGVSFGYSIPPMKELAPAYFITHFRELPLAIDTIINDCFS